MTSGKMDGKARAPIKMKAKVEAKTFVDSEEEVKGAAAASEDATNHENPKGSKPLTSTQQMIQQANEYKKQKKASKI